MLFGEGAPEVVILGTVDLHLDHVAGLEALLAQIRDEDLAVDFRGVGRGPARI
jgi:hypothetical protein